jgi:hypothetical protein
MSIRAIINRFRFASKTGSHTRQVYRKRQAVRRLSLVLESCETRQMLKLPPTLTIPLIPDLDQFGDQILIVQGFGVPERAALGIFDTGASAVTFAATDQEVFAGIEEGPIPIKVPGGAAAGGIGGEIVGDVSEPGTIFSDGMHAFDLSFDEFGFPQFNITLSPSALETPGIQAFVGTESSPLLPTITGTPALHASPKYPDGAAAYVSMQGAKIDFSDIFPDLIIPFPDLTYTVPGTTITYDTADTTLYEPVTLPFIPFGGDNFDDPGDLITDTNLYLIPAVTGVMDTTTSIPADFLFDTGAQLSVISTDMALSLGLDLDNPTTSIDVQGVAGNETVPGFTISKLIFPRTDGGTLEFTDVPIYVLDVAPGIGGIFGMNLMNVANQFVFDPHHAEGPRVSIQFFANPDRGGGGIDIGGELAALLGGSLGAMFGSLGGQKIPSFSPPPGSPLTTTTAITVPTGSLEYGASFSLTTKVNGQPGSPVPTGSIELTKGGVTFATMPLNADGIAIWSAPSTPWEVGSYSVTAKYNGDSKYAASTSTSSAFEIVKAKSAISLQTSSSQVTIGSLLQITGKLTSSTGASTSGSMVVILVDGAQAATATVAADGSFSTSITHTTAGSHTIQAQFSGSAFFQNATSNVLNIQAIKYSSNVVLNISKSSIEYGEAFSINATVAGGSGTPVPSGSVELSGNSAKFATVPLDPTGLASWQFTTDPWTFGSYSIVAAYAGDSRFSGSSSTAATIEVTKAGTSLAISAGANQIPYGGPVQLSGKLLSNTGVSTSGSVVKFLVNGSLATTVTVGSDGAYSVTIPSGSAGSYKIQAVFEESALFKSSTSEPVSIEVIKAVGNLALSIPAKIVFGQKTQIVANLASSTMDAFQNATVIFYDGTKEIGRTTLKDGLAAIPLSATQTGKSYQFSAVITESANAQRIASGNTAIVVGKADTKISLTALSPPRRGRPSPGLTIRVTPVLPGEGIPTGSVTITLANKRARPKVIALSNGTAVYRFTGNANKPVKISFNGNTNFNSTVLNS